MSFTIFTDAIAEQKSQHRYRKRQCIAEQSARYVVIDGQRYLNFSSNDYLALNHHKDINKALQEGADKFGVCASASSLITGYSYAHQALENEICQWLNKEQCLLFNSGFTANHSLMQALGHKNCTLFLDKLSHASLIDGAMASHAKVKRFFHNDYQHLTHLLSKENPQDKVIVCEGVYSMDGDQADVQQLSTIAQQHQALTYVDDAHSIGVIGEDGSGSSSLAEVDVVMATFGKAIATSGAMVACNKEIADYLINFSRHYIYSTAISPAMAWATLKSIAIIQQEHWRREKIAELSAFLKSQLPKNVSVTQSNSSIHGIILGSEQLTLSVCEQLKEKGIWLTAIRPPTVAPNSSRLRVTITSNHEINDIKYLIDCVSEVMH